MLLPTVGSVVLHVGLVLALFGASWLAPRPPPLIDPEHALEVSMVMLPKSDTRMPQKASQVPTPQATAEAPVKTAVEAPPNPSDLVYKTDEAPPEQTEGQKDQSNQREALVRKMMMQQAIASAATGPVNRSATDPDSSDDAPSGAVGAGPVTDAELAQYIAQLTRLFNQNFRPLPTITMSNPDIKCVITVLVDESGKVTSRTMKTPSGNASYDGAAMRAVDAVSSLPKPPERYAHLAAKGYDIVFTPPR